jgi:hypothetical protein
MFKSGSTRGTSPDLRSSGRRYEQVGKQTERRSSSSKDSEDSGSGSKPSSMVGTENQATGGFPFRETALMPEGLTGGKVQQVVGGAFIPSTLARTYSLSLQKGVTGTVFRGMMAAARAEAAARRKIVEGAKSSEEMVVLVVMVVAGAAAEGESTAETKAEAAAEEMGLWQSFCNFVANWRRKEAPRRGNAMVGSRGIGKCSEGHERYTSRKKSGQAIGSRKSWQTKKSFGTVW